MSMFEVKDWARNWKSRNVLKQRGWSGTGRTRRLSLGLNSGIGGHYSFNVSNFNCSDNWLFSNYFKVT